MGNFEPPTVLPRLGVFRLLSFNVPKDAHGWEKIANRRGGKGRANKRMKVVPPGFYEAGIKN